MSVWPHPEHLLAPEIAGALAAATDGDVERALAASRTVPRGDPLAEPTLRVVRGLAAHARGDAVGASKLLLPCTRDRDPAIVLLATEALVDQRVRARRYAGARALLRRARRRLHRPVEELWADATQAWIELERRGTLSDAHLVDLIARLERQHPPAVHALVLLVSAEQAAYQGNLAGAVTAHRAARPFVQAARSHVARERHAALAQLLQAPYAEVEDWEAPSRPVSREEVAELETRPWQVWVDGLHRRMLVREADGGPLHVLRFAADPKPWSVLETLVRSPAGRLAEPNGAAALAVPELEVRARLEELARRLATAGLDLERRGTAWHWTPGRFVFLAPTQRLGPVAHRLLGELAQVPGSRAAELATRIRANRRTVVRHLGVLRQQGYVRMVGGGSEARYVLV